MRGAEISQIAPIECGVKMFGDRLDWNAQNVHLQNDE
jgi:hypothetical protein